MLACFSRQRVVGGLIVALACTLCVTPMICRGQADAPASEDQAVDGGDVEGQTTFYAPPSSRDDSKVAEDRAAAPPPDSFDFRGGPTPPESSETPLTPREHVSESPVVPPLRPGMVTIDDIIAMTRSGVPADVIVPHVEGRGMAQAVNAADILRMQQQGVAASVLSAAQRVATKLATPDHIVESKSFFLVKTTYRLSGAKAESLAQLLQEQVGRPEIFEVSLDEPDTLSITASPRAQNAIGELVALVRAAEADHKKTADQKNAAGAVRWPAPRAR